MPKRSGQALLDDARRKKKRTTQYARLQVMPGLMLPPAGGDFDLSGERPMIGLSGGINSAALLVYVLSVMPEALRPRELYLYHADLVEHSDDTLAFVADCHAWARRRFRERGLDPAAVRFGMHTDTAVGLFERDAFIPHPTLSPCTERLKLKPMRAWADRQREAEGASAEDPTRGPSCDLIGYVLDEEGREVRSSNKAWSCSRGPNLFPIRHLTDADCFALVDEHVGWHPAIYDVLREDGRRAFPRNNCLPCKNMHPRQLDLVRLHHPAKAARADAMAERTGLYWGRYPEASHDSCSYACST